MNLEVGKCLLSNLLRAAGMTQAQLSDLTGISQQQISKYVNEENVMSYKNARKIATALKCRMEDLYTVSIGK